MLFLEGLSKILKKGGSAFIVEYAGSSPKPKALPGHTEYSIDFEALIKVARHLGFSVSTGSMTDILGIDHQHHFVDPITINLNLFLGEREPTKELLDLFFRHLERYTLYDYAMTQKECEQQSLKVESSWLKSMKEKTDKFQYLFLRKA